MYSEQSLIQTSLNPKEVLMRSFHFLSQQARKEKMKFKALRTRNDTVGAMITIPILTILMSKVRLTKNLNKPLKEDSLWSTEEFWQVRRMRFHVLQIRLSSNTVTIFVTAVLWQDLLQKRMDILQGCSKWKGQNSLTETANQVIGDWMALSTELSLLPSSISTRALQ